MQVCKIFTMPYLQGDCQIFFSGFEVFSVIWIHLGHLICMSPTLGVIAIFQCDHMCFGCELDSLEPSNF